LVVHVQRFDAFGAPENPTAQAADVPPRNLRAGYTGHEMDSETGLVNMRGRIYDPRLGRFLQPDPFLRPNSSQGLNRYSYAFNNPLRWIDPSGFMPEDEETGTVDSAGDGDVGNGDVDEEFPFPPTSAGGESGSESGGEDGSVSGGEDGSEPGGEEGSEPGGEEGSEPRGEETVCDEEDFESTEEYEDYNDDSEYESQSTPTGEGAQSDGHDSPTEESAGAAFLWQSIGLPILDFGPFDLGFEVVTIQGWDDADGFYIETIFAIGADFGVASYYEGFGFSVNSSGDHNDTAGFHNAPVAVADGTVVTPVGPVVVGLWDEGNGDWGPYYGMSGPGHTAARIGFSLPDSWTKS
jgi:RHS repeat-associated protein